MYHRIQALRTAAGLSQQEVADFLQCSQTVYRAYERGERAIPLAIAIRLALFYGTSVDYLAGLTDERKPHPRT